MGYCSFNKTSAVLIKCLTFGGTNSSEEFSYGSIQDSTLYALGFSYSNDFGYSFTFGRADNVLLKLNLSSEVPILLKNIGYATGNEKPFSLLVSGAFMHFGWNEDEQTLKTQVLYS